MEFTVIAKQVKLTALHNGIRTPQYLDNYLVRDRFHQTYLQHTQTLVALCQSLGWVVNLEKIRGSQAFDFIGYQFNLKEGKDRPTLELWQTLTTKIQELLPRLTCLVRQLMSLIRFANSHRKTSPQVTLEEQLEGTRISEKR